MPTPEELEKLNELYRGDYDELIGVGVDPDEAYQTIFAQQQKEMDAKKRLTEEAQISEAVRTGKTGEIPQEIRDVLDLDSGDTTYKPFSQFMPGFKPRVDEDRPALPPASFSQRSRLVYDPKRIDNLQQEAIKTATSYYIGQGFPSYEKAQIDSVNDFIEKYGSKAEFVKKDPLKLGDQAGARYDLMFSIAQKPPMGFTQSAEQKAYEDLIGDRSDPSVFGNLKRPDQPRRFQQFGELEEEVGPRAPREAIPTLPIPFTGTTIDVPTADGKTVPKTFDQMEVPLPGRTMFQGASPLAEDLREQPELAREMSTSQLAVEAFRPQVVKSGEQVRRERAKQKEKADVLLGAQMAKIEKEQLTEEDAFNEVVDTMLVQARKQAKDQLEGRVTPKMLLDYHTGSLTAMGRLGMFPSQQEIFDDLIETIATNAVLNEYRAAGMYDYALKYDKLKGGRTYGTRAMGVLDAALKYATEDATSSNYIQQLKKQGRIDKDAIVEATPMQYARNLNFVFRLAINPVVDIASETILPTFRTGDDEVEFAEKYGQRLVSPTVELTDEFGIEPINVMDAYLKEVLVETATGRTLGNDIVSLIPEVYFRGGQADFTEEQIQSGDLPWRYSPDAFVIGGTIGEIAVPVEAPLILAKAGVQGASKLPANYRLYGQLNKELDALGALGNAGKQTPSYQLFELTGPKMLGGEGIGIIKNSSKVSSHVADDAADIVLAMERVEDGVTNPELVKQGLSARGQAVGDALLAKSDPAAEASKVMDQLVANPEGTPALHIAAKDSRARTFYGKDTTAKGGTRAKKRIRREREVADPTNPKETLDVVAETIAHDAMKGKVAAQLEGQFGLGDYHLLTDRVAVSGRFLDKMEKVPARYGPDGIAKVPGKVPGTSKKLKGTPGEKVMETVTDAQGNSYQQVMMVDKPMPIRLIEDVNEVLGPLKAESTGPRVLRQEPFVGTKYKDGMPDPNVLQGEPIMGLGSTTGKGFTQQPVNFNRLFQADAPNDPFLANILEKAKSGRPLTYAEDVYIRQRALEKFAGIRGGMFGKSDDVRIIDMDADPRELFPGRAMDAEGKIVNQMDVLPVQEGSQFAERIGAPVSRRADTIDVQIAPGVKVGEVAVPLDATQLVRSVSPIQVRDGLKAADETLRSPLQAIDDLGKPIDPTVTKIQKAQEEAVVSLQRQTPIVASTLRKQGFDHADVVDEMFNRAVNGEDYTLIVKEKAPASPTKTPINANVSDDTVEAFYERLLGPAFNLPENRAAFKTAISGKTNPQLLEQGTIIEVMTKMQRENPQALFTAAVKPDAFGPAKKLGRLMAQDMTPDKVNIAGAKISYAVDATRAIRVRKVITETMPQGQINIAFYANKLNLSNTETAKLIDSLSAEYMGFGKATDLPPGARGLLDRPARMQSNYFMGVRSEATKLGNTPENVAEVVQEAMRLYANDVDDLALIGGGQKAIEKVILDPETQTAIAQNLTRLQRAPNDNLEYLEQLYRYNIALRKRLVSGQLGGLLFPNIIYHAENFVTAPMIASVTSPEYVGTVIAQQLRTPTQLITGRSASVAGDVLQETGAVADDLKVFGVGLDKNPMPQMGGAGLNRYVTRQIGDQKYIGNYTMEEAIDLYRTKNLGNTQASLHLDDNFIRDVQKMAGEYGIDNNFIALGLTGPGKGTSFGMQFADSTDRMFREAVFFKALSEGKTGDQASQLAREVLLDYGAMPRPMQDTVGKAFLYMSFSYMMGQEMIKGLADPRKFRSIVAQLNYHRKTSEDIFGRQTELTDHVLYNEMKPLSEKDLTAYNVYYRNPTIGTFKQLSSMAEGGRNTAMLTRELRDFAQTPQVMEAGLGAILDMGYNPYIALLKETEMEYKKGVPSKVVYQISSIDPEWGLWFKDLFDMEYVPMEKRRTGKAEIGVQRYYVDPQTMERVKMTPEQLEKGIDLDGDGEIDIDPRGGYQLQFKSTKGYDNFLRFQTILQFGGYQRLMNDVTGTLIAAGQLPEGTSFGYEETNSGVLKPVLYLVGRQKTIRVPKEWEKLDRQVRQQETELRKFMEGYK